MDTESPLLSASMYFYLSLGSNICPEQSAVRMVRELSEHFGTLRLYPFRYTEPEHIATNHKFINGLVILRSSLSQECLKDILNDIEERMGRNRKDPQRSVKDRAADIDILHHSKQYDPLVFAQAKERYIQDCFELNNDIVDLSHVGLPSHKGPSTIYFDALTGNIRIRDEEFDCL